MESYFGLSLGLYGEEKLMICVPREKNSLNISISHKVKATWGGVVLIILVEDNLVRSISRGLSCFSALIVAFIDRNG